VRSITTSVASIDDVSFPLSRTLQFREANVEVADLVNAPTDFDGVIVGRDGRVRALWSSFATEAGRDVVQLNRGIPIDLVQEAVEAARANTPLYSLEAEFEVVPISAARKLGLPDDWVRRIEAHDGSHRQVLSVARLVAGSPASASLRAGDLLLAVNGKPVNRFREVEKATRAPKVTVTVLRDGQETSFEVATAALGGRDIDRLLAVGRACCMRPIARCQLRAIRLKASSSRISLTGRPPRVTSCSPVAASSRSMATLTPDLDAFIAAVRGRADRSSVRLKTSRGTARPRS